MCYHVTFYEKITFFGWLRALLVSLQQRPLLTLQSLLVRQSSPEIGNIRFHSFIYHYTNENNEIMFISILILLILNKIFDVNSFYCVHNEEWSNLCFQDESSIYKSKAMFYLSCKFCKTFFPVIKKHSWHINQYCCKILIISTINGVKIYHAHFLLFEKIVRYLLKVFEKSTKVDGHICSFSSGLVNV